MYSILELENCVFLNSTSKYATAVFLEMPLVAKNCIFKDLHSTQSAGAIGLKSPFEVVIENCTFINNKESKNGGAMFLDMIRDMVLCLEMYLLQTPHLLMPMEIMVGQ